MLEKVPLHIDPSLNKDIDKSPGINVPSYYLSGALSFSEVHSEDGYLDSCNIVHRSRENLAIHSSGLFHSLL